MCQVDQHPQSKRVPRIVKLMLLLLLLFCFPTENHLRQGMFRPGVLLKSVILIGTFSRTFRKVSKSHGINLFFLLLFVYRPIYTEHCAACSNQTQTVRVYHNADSCPSKHETWPDVFSMLVQRRWPWANSETSLGRILRLLGSTQVSVYTHPSPTIIFSPADQGTFSKTAGQSQAYYNTWNWKRGTYDVNHLHILTCEVAVSRVSSVRPIKCLMYFDMFCVNLHDFVLLNTVDLKNTVF